MSLVVLMGFKRKLLRLTYPTYLLMVICNLAHQQQEEVRCGLNSYPSSNGSCICLPGFFPQDSSTHSKICQRNSLQQLSCDSSGSRMERIEEINWPEYDYDTFKNVNNTECAQACLEDCLCMVVIHNNDLQQCWKKSMPLPGGRVDNSSIAFVKVYKVVPVTCATPKPRGEKKGKELTVIGISLVGFSFIFAVILLIIWLYTCGPKLKALQEHQKFDPVGLRAFSFQDIDTATRGFKQEVGRGSFGKVYRGDLPDGRQIAVKKLDILVMEGQHKEEKEFRTEMGIIGVSHHKNLVKLYGFCHEGFHRLLVYEYMPNGSLDKVLFKGARDLDWEVRVQITLGIARGLQYLHEECTSPILHCDIKPQNILLDEKYHAKIADFGISKLLGAEQTRTFTEARGTIGYIAPEWKKSMAVSMKVDVYSFGVVLLEIICCRKMFVSDVPENEMVLCDWAYDCLKYGRLGRLVEQQDCRDVDATQLERMVLTGLWCLQEDPDERPSMKNVVHMLEGTIEIRVPPGSASSFHKRSVSAIEPSVISSLALSM